MDENDKTPLDALDIEWVEPNVCAETFENRRALREGGHRWRPVPADPETGMPSGLIEVPDPVRAQQSMLQKNAAVLVDPRDPWSDYVDVRELPIDATGVPYWIHKRAEKWEEWNASEGSESVTDGGKTIVKKEHKGKEPFLPTRCTSIKKDGTRCWAWCAEAANDGHCRAHAPGAALAANMGHQIALAKLKVIQAQPAMADALEELALTATSEQVRLKAVTEMMDRGGVHASTEVNIGVSGEQSDPAAAIRDRLSNLSERLLAAQAVQAAADAENTVDAEIVEEDQHAAQ